MAGYSGTPLWKKLGLRPNIRAGVINSPVDYPILVEAIPEGFLITDLKKGDLDYLHVFMQKADDLNTKFSEYQFALAKNGVFWVSWPRKGSGIETDLNENMIREIGLANGMVDVKVCTVNEQWSGLKFVYRLKDRRS